MSYSLMTPCYNCKKRFECTDMKKLQDSINDIHQNPENHKGSGNIMIMCVKMDAEYK